MGTTFAIHSEVAERVELCLFDEATGAESRLDLPDTSGFVHHGYVAGHLAGPALRLPRPRAVGAPRGAPLQSRQAPARSVRQGDPRRRPLGRRRLPATGSARRGRARRPRFGGPRPAFGGHQPVLRLGRRPRSAPAAQRDDHLRGPRQGLHDPHPTCRGRCAARTRAWRIRVAVDYLESLGRHGGRAAAGPPFHPRPAPARRQGLRNYWGYNSIGFFAPHDALRARPAGEATVAEFKAMVKALHAAGIEVILDVVYNHTAEGNHLGPTLSFKGHRQRHLLPAGRRRPALLHGLHGHAATRSTCAHPARAAADHGQPALLGAPRCTSTASASTSRRRWRASCTRSTGCRRSSTSSTRTRCSAR